MSRETVDLLGQVLDRSVWLHIEEDPDVPAHDDEVALPRPVAVGPARREPTLETQPARRNRAAQRTEPTLRVDLELTVLPEPGGRTVAQTKQTFVLSYDLWEERFAVTLAGPPPRSTSYLTSSAAEAWCLEQLTMSISAMGVHGQDGPFWVRLAYRIPEGEARPAQDNGGPYSLQGLLDVFTPRRKGQEWSHSIEAGPFRIKQ